MVSCTSIVTDMCVALGCQTSDKCYPCPLANGDYSTRTGMLIRDAYQPIFSILQEHLKDLSETGKGQSDFIGGSRPKRSLGLLKEGKFENNKDKNIITKPFKDKNIITKPLMIL